MRQLWAKGSYAERESLLQQILTQMAWMMADRIQVSEMDGAQFCVTAYVLPREAETIPAGSGMIMQAGNLTQPEMAALMAELLDKAAQGKTFGYEFQRKPSGEDSIIEELRGTKLEH